MRLKKVILKSDIKFCPPGGSDYTNTLTTTRDGKPWLTLTRKMWDVLVEYQGKRLCIPMTSVAYYETEEGEELEETAPAPVRGKRA